MFGLFQSRKSLITKYGGVARGMIAEFGEGAQARAQSRAAQCERGSREYKHWSAVAKTIGYINK